MKKILILIALFSNHAIADEWQFKYAADSLFNVIVEKRLVKEDVSGLIYSLCLLKNEVSDSKLIDLSMYYLGSSGGEELDSCITNRGEAVLPLISKALIMIKTCNENICASNIEIKTKLEYWQGLIRNGVKIEFIP